jgi:predicted lipid-binding transport protein (Tim44 family)
VTVSIARLRWFFVFALAAFLALAPALAEARAGSKGSFGSRGARTYQSNDAQPMQRSTAPQASPASQASRPGATAPGAQQGFFQRNPFLTGMLGGLLGAGLFGLIFGGAFGGLSGLSGMLGLLLQLALIGGLAYLALRIWRSMRQPAEATAGAGAYARSATPFGGLGGALGGGAASAPARPADPVEIPVDAADYDAWSALLVDIQDAWTRGDLGRMRALATPEMLGYFSEELSALASRGVENRVEQVELLKGDVEEAWSEGEMEYVTARLRWRALDYTVRLGSEEVVEGSRSAPSEASEVWTFVRARGGKWLLSAIQQV